MNTQYLFIISRIIASIRVLFMDNRNVLLSAVKLVLNKKKRPGEKE